MVSAFIIAFTSKTTSSSGSQMVTISFEKLIEVERALSVCFCGDRRWKEMSRWGWGTEWVEGWPECVPYSVVPSFVPWQVLSCLPLLIEVSCPPSMARLFFS